MSNSSSSPVVLRIQQSAVVFVVLILALGALVLAANNIDPNASVRGDVRYSLWKSPDGMYSMEYPAGWSVKQVTNKPPTFDVSPDDGSASGTIGLVNLSDQKITDADKNPKNVLDTIVARRSANPAINQRAVIVDGIQGYAGTAELPSTDSKTGDTVASENDLWIIPLDGSHAVYVSILSKGSTSTAIKPLEDHMLDTLRIDEKAALLALGVGVPTQTPTTAPTQAATTVATEASTSAATAAGTTAP